MNPITFKGYLYLILKDETLQVGFGIDGTIFYSCEEEKSENLLLPCIIQDFLKHHKLALSQIKAVVILNEIQGLFSRLVKAPARKIAYLQLSKDYSAPMQFMNRVGSSGCSLTLAYIREDCNQEAKQLLKGFQKKGIREIAINAYYSPLKPDLEEDLARTLERRTPGIFHFITPEVEDYQPYLVKENKLLINTVLKQPLSKRWDEISSVLPGKPLLFCCGDGYIRNRIAIEENPLLLWQSGQTQLLKGASRTHGVNTFIAMLPWGDNGLCLNMVKDGIPQISSGSTRFSGLPIILNTLRSTTSITWPTSHKMRELFATISPTQGPVEILNGTDEKRPSEFLSYRVRSLNRFKRIHMMGMAGTPYHKRSYRVIKSQKLEHIRVVEREMIEDSRREEIKLGLEIINRKREFKLTTLKYLQRGWGMLYLDTTGELN